MSRHVSMSVFVSVLHSLKQIVLNQIKGRIFMSSLSVYLSKFENAMILLPIVIDKKCSNF